jgi:hypothetical protein
MAATNVQAFSGDVEITSNLAVNTNDLFVDTVEGRVGIGTTDPKTPLEVRQSDGYFNSMYIQKYLGAGPELATSYVLLLKSESSNPKRLSGKISGVRGYSSTNNTFEAEIIAGVGSAAALTGRMTFTFSGNSNNFYAKLVSLTYNSSTYIALALIPTLNYNGVSGGIYFNGKTNAIDELQYITDLGTVSNIVDFPVSGGDKTTFTGNVGIGATSPRQKLDLGDLGGGSIRLGRDHDDDNTSTNRIGRTGVDNDIWYSSINFIDENTNDDAISFVTHQSGVEQAERMRISGNGNVGIGTNNPLSPLDIRAKKGILTATSLQNLYSNASVMITGHSENNDALCIGMLGTDTAGNSGNNPYAYIQNIWDQSASILAQPLLLQPTGGSVAINTTTTGGVTLNVNGTTYAAHLQSPNNYYNYNNIGADGNWRTTFNIGANAIGFFTVLSNNAGYGQASAIWWYQYKAGGTSGYVSRISGSSTPNFRLSGQAVQSQGSGQQFVQVRSLPVST